MKKLMLVTVLGSLVPFASAESAKFSDVDTDKDGSLSTSEAKLALPEVLIVDSNNDGMLNPSEAEVAIPGLTLSVVPESEKGSGLIGPDEYERIITALEQLTSGRSDEGDS